MRRLIIVLIVVVVSVLAFGMSSGYLPPASEALLQLAMQPDVAGEFADAQGGRFDATVFLFTVLILTPIVAVGVAVGLMIVIMLLEGTVMEIGRWFGLPDTVMMAAMVAAIVGVAYAKAPLWLHGSLRLLGIVARAYLVATA